MENRIYYRPNNLSRCQSSQRLKFKQIPIKKQFNELHSKYEIYNQGTPNIYSDDLDMLRAKNIKEQISMVDLPNLQHFITQINQSEKDKLLNQRNYDMYPTLLKQTSNKFKDILSEKQEIKDFILWFEQQYENIEKSKDSNSKKFKDKQTLIAAGFTQMTGCVAKLSKNRSEILKMLWNRQNFEIKSIIQGLNVQKIKTEKELLQQISTLHNDYQKMIEQLSKSNKDLDEQLKKETTFSHNCVVNLRILRKRIKKLEYAGKKLAQSNNSLKKQNLHLMQENIKLLANIKEISQEEAVVLNYRKLQIHSQKLQLKFNPYKNLVELTRQNEQDTLTPFIDFQRKKNTLKQYFQQRIKQNPDEKVLIKEDYFMYDEECPKSIEEFFKSVINRPNIQMELLSQIQNQPFTKEKAVNTQIIPQPRKQQISALTLDKGIQVQLIQTIAESQNKIDCKWRQRRVYQIIDQKEEQEKEKQSKIRLIKHRISRKNSLTLLQLQNLKEISHNILQKKHGLSHFRKQRNGLDNKNEQSNLSIGNSQNVVSEQQSEASEQILIQNSPNKTEFNQISIPISTHNKVRKSQNFTNILKQLKTIQSKSEHQKSQPKKYMNLITIEGQVREQLKQNQLQDLIQKHLQNNNQVVTQNPEKSLNKILMSVFKNVWQKDKINFLFQLLEVIKNSYGNIKSVIWKFLNAISLIHSSQTNNSLLKVISVLLKINKNYDIYSLVNTHQVADIYFSLFKVMTIKNINDNAFNLWKCCTTCEKIRGLEFASALELFFSEKKRKYIDHKINKFIAVSQVQSQSKKSSKNSSSKKIQSISQENEIIKLNPLILYIIQVYLIEKQLYDNSYSDIIKFLSSEDDLLSAQVFIWLLELFGYTEKKQIEIINYAFFMKPKQKSLRETQNTNYQKFIKTQMFYRCCVKFDFPLFQEVFVLIHQIFKKLPHQVQKKYYKMIKLQQWYSIKEDLIRKYQRNSQSNNYFDAFKQVGDKLERQLKKGASIYREYAPLEQVKRSEQVFSFFYKTLIISAHPSQQPIEKEFQKSDIV